MPKSPRMNPRSCRIARQRRAAHGPAQPRTALRISADVLAVDAPGEDPQSRRPRSLLQSRLSKSRCLHLGLVAALASRTARSRRTRRRRTARDMLCAAVCRWRPPTTQCSTRLRSPVSSAEHFAHHDGYIRHGALAVANERRTVHRCPHLRLQLRESPSVAPVCVAKVGRDPGRRRSQFRVTQVFSLLLEFAAIDRKRCPPLWNDRGGRVRRCDHREFGGRPQNHLAAPDTDLRTRRTHRIDDVGQHLAPLDAART
jgi:hypothetical protein